MILCSYTDIIKRMKSVHANDNSKYINLIIVRYFSIYVRTVMF